jgi:hypothetical protein
MKTHFAIWNFVFEKRGRGRDSVLECASPLALSTGGDIPKRQRTAAVQNLADFPSTFLK